MQVLISWGGLSSSTVYVDPFCLTGPESEKRLWCGSSYIDHQRSSSGLSFPLHSGLASRDHPTSRSCSRSSWSHAFSASRNRDAQRRWIHSFTSRFNPVDRRQGWNHPDGHWQGSYSFCGACPGCLLTVVLDGVLCG